MARLRLVLGCARFGWEWAVSGLMGAPGSRGRMSSSALSYLTRGRALERDFLRHALFCKLSGSVPVRTLDLLGAVVHGELSTACTAVVCELRFRALFAACLGTLFGVLFVCSIRAGSSGFILLDLVAVRGSRRRWWWRRRMMMVVGFVRSWARHFMAEAAGHMPTVAVVRIAVLWLALIDATLVVIRAHVIIVLVWGPIAVCVALTDRHSWCGGCVTGGVLLVVTVVVIFGGG